MTKRFGRMVTGTLVAFSMALLLMGCGQTVTGVDTVEQDQDQQVQTLGDPENWW